MKLGSHIAIVCGIAIGFAAASPSGGSRGVADAATEAAAPTNREIGEADLPPGLLDGLSPTQRRTVLRALNEEPCGCGKGTVAACLAHGLCPRSPSALRQAIELAKLGQTSDTIRTALRSAPSGRSAPAPEIRLGGGTRSGGGHEDHLHPGHRADDGKKGPRPPVRQAHFHGSAR